MTPLSVLDLSVVRDGGTSAHALADTTELARSADRLGMQRFWVAMDELLESADEAVASGKRSGTGRLVIAS